MSAPIDYSDRPQYIAQSASGALYYSTRPTSEATPGTLRRIDNFLDPRAEPRQIWQYGAVDAWTLGHPQRRRMSTCSKARTVCPIRSSSAITRSGQDPSTSQCVQDGTIPDAVASLRADRTRTSPR